jgi:malonate transporter and related proteins
VNTISTIIVPFFALILFGYTAARLNWVPAAAVPAFNGFLLYFAVPALLFRFASTAAFSDIMNGRFFAAYTAAGLLTLAAVVLVAWRLLGSRLRDASFYGLASSATNVGYLAIPLLVALIGETAAAPAMLASVAELTIVAAVAVGLSQLGSVEERGWIRGVRDAFARAALNPFIVSMVLGAAFSGMQWKLPTPAEEIVRLLANAAGPCALFAIGVSVFRPDTPLRSAFVALSIAGKLLLHPLAVWAMMLLFGVDDFTMTVGVLTAALPTAGWTFIFAQRYGADAGRVSASVLLSTALSFITFSALVWFLGMDVPAR